MPPLKTRTNTRRTKGNVEKHDRKYLTLSEIISLREAARKIGRYKHRDYMLILVAYRHALRVSELVNLKWSQIDVESKQLHVIRMKNSKPSVHPIEDDELEGLLELKHITRYESEYVFVSRDGDKLDRTSVSKIVERAGIEAGLKFKVHPHMLRHAKGYSLVNSDKNFDFRNIQDYLGHRNIQHTVLYTELDGRRLKQMGTD